MINNIPKVLHLYWDGSAMPLLCFLTVFTFRKLNPKWSIKIYSPLIRSATKLWKSNENKIEYEGQDYYEYLKIIENCSFVKFDFEKIGIANQTSEIQKSDFLRWHLLSTEGGAWSDFDIIYFRGLDEITFTNQDVSRKNEEIDFSVCYDFNNPSNYKYSIGFLMAVKECVFYKKLLQTSIENFNQYDYQGAGAQILNKKYPKIQDLYNSEKDSNIWNMSMDLLYAHDHTKIRCIYETIHLGFFTQNSIGVHFYYGSPITKDFINNFDLKNQKISNTLSIVIDKFNENTGYSSL